MKITVVYHSESGNTAKMAECIVKGIQSVEGMEADYSVALKAPVRETGNQ